jgi:polyisoprenoid-binding protein YceI
VREASDGSKESSRRAGVATYSVVGCARWERQIVLVARRTGRRPTRHETEKAIAMVRHASSRIVLLALIGVAGTARADPAMWTSMKDKSEITLHVLKKGLFAGMAHDHHFVPEDWRATARLDETNPPHVEVDLVVAADSLRDRQPELSPEDREKVNRQAAGPDVLDARRHPEIRFTCQKLETDGSTHRAEEGAVAGMLVGTLSLHGRERPISIPVRATKEGDAWRARGSISFKQSDFGIHPYSGFLGTVAVHDAVKLDYDIVLTRLP